MKFIQAIELLNDIGSKFSEIHIVIPVPEGPSPSDVEKALQDIQARGYSAYIETVAIGDQIVVTEIDERIRSTRNET